MKVDIHTHLSVYPDHISRAYAAEAERAHIPLECLTSDPEKHSRGTKGADRVVVLGFQAPYSGIVVPNDFISDYVKRDPRRFVGFMSVDPNNPGCLAEMERSRHQLGLRGLKLGPMYQDFAPNDRTKAYPVYAKAQQLGLPILFHLGTTYTRTSRLAYTRPVLLEDPAIDFPELRMIVAHLGHPYEAETIVLIRKQPNVYADVSALHRRPWQFYNSLRLAYEYGVFDKLFFGTDFPFATAEDTAQGMLAICRLAQRAGLPQIPEELVRGVIDRNSLAILGL